jgi:hypothetical protein
MNQRVFLKDIDWINFDPTCLLIFVWSFYKFTIKSIEFEVRKYQRRETEGKYIKGDIVTSRLISFEQVKINKNILFEVLHFDLLAYYHCWTIWKLKSISFVQNGINCWYGCMANFDDYWTSIRWVPNKLFAIFIGHKYFHQENVISV